MMAVVATRAIFFHMKEVGQVQSMLNSACGWVRSVEVSR